MDLLYFLAHQMPFDIDFSRVSEERALAAYRIFRQMMSDYSKFVRSPVPATSLRDLGR